MGTKYCWQWSGIAIILLCLMLHTLPSHSNLVAVSEPEETDNDGPEITAIEHPNLLHNLNPQLVEALRNLNDDPSPLKSNERIVDLTNIPHITPERMAEMLEVFDWLDSQMPPEDAEQIKTLLDRITNDTLSWSDPLMSTQQQQQTNGTATENIINDLEILRDFLDQIDNGLDFGKMGGLTVMLNIFNNDTLPIEIRSAAMHTYGAAIQNNIGAIGIALSETNVIPSILYNLKLTLPSGVSSIVINADSNAAVNDDDSILSQLDLSNSDNCDFIVKMIYTLSALTRSNEDGLVAFIKMNGDTIIYDWCKAISDDSIATVDRRNQLRIGNKLFAFVSDIIAINPTQRRLFIDEHWCDIMQPLLSSDQFSFRETALQYFSNVLQRSLCTQPVVLRALVQSLESVENIDAQTEFDEAQKIQSKNILKFITQTYADRLEI